MNISKNHNQSFSFFTHGEHIGDQRYQQYPTPFRQICFLLNAAEKIIEFLIRLIQGAVIVITFIPKMLLEILLTSATLKIPTQNCDKITVADFSHEPNSHIKKLLLTDKRYYNNFFSLITDSKILDSGDHPDSIMVSFKHTITAFQSMMYAGQQKDLLFKDRAKQISIFAAALPLTLVLSVIGLGMDVLTISMSILDKLTLSILNFPGLISDYPNQSPTCRCNLSPR